MTDRISDYLFCPTDTAVDNLKNEGFDTFENEIVKSGDVMQDAALFYAQQSEEKSDVIQKNKLKDFILCTLHRAENTDDPKRLKSIVNALNQINKTTPIVLPLHPRTKGKIEALGIQLEATIIDPVGYFDMIELLKNCKLVMTDSGGLQKEAYFFRKNCLTMRDQTEWVELVENKVNVLCGADEDKIIREAKNMLDQSSNFDINLYGNGLASNSIAKFIWENKN